MYGITLAQKALILREQGNCCAVCRRDVPGSSRGWFTDHNHATGEVRGVLCINCNTFIGHACKAAGSEEAAQLEGFLGSRVLQYLNEGKILVKRVVLNTTSRNEPSYMTPVPKLFMPTRRQFELLTEFSEGTFKRCDDHNGGGKSDRLFALVKRGLIERKIREGLTRRGNKPKQYVYRRTPAGTMLVVAERHRFEMVIPDEYAEDHAA